MDDETLFEDDGSIMQSHPIDSLMTSDEVSDQEDDTYTHPIEVFGQQLFVNPSNIHKKIVKISANISNGYLDIARLIFFVRAGKLYKQWGYSSLEEYSTQELGFARRTSHYFVGIYAVLIATLGADHDDLLAIGWSKAKEIVRLAMKGVVNSTNLKDWIDKARHLPYKEFLDAVREALKTEALPSCQKTYRFSVNGDNIELVERGMSLAKRVANTEDDALALVLMATEMISTYGDSQDLDTFILLMRRLEERFGLKINVEKEGIGIYPNPEEEIDEGDVIEADRFSYKENAENT